MTGVNSAASQRRGASMVDNPAWKICERAIARADEMIE
jgi:hypothetical protein